MTLNVMNCGRNLKTVSSWAAMQDDGNFVLLGGNSNPIWESFQEPNDTLLPGQILNSPINLTSRRTPQNYSAMRFWFLLKGNGNLKIFCVYSKSLMMFIGVGSVELRMLILS